MSTFTEDFVEEIEEKVKSQIIHLLELHLLYFSRTTSQKSLPQVSLPRQTLSSLIHLLTRGLSAKQKLSSSSIWEQLQEIRVP